MNGNKRSISASSNKSKRRFANYFNVIEKLRKFSKQLRSLRRMKQTACCISENLILFTN